MSETKQVPYNKDAEESVIGSLLTGAKINQLNLEVNDFFTEKMRVLFNASVELDNRGVPVDQITLIDELKRNGDLSKIGELSIIPHLIANCPTSLDAEYYADIVKRLAHHRKLIQIGSVISDLGYQPNGELDDKLQQADELLIELRKGVSQLSIVSPEDRASRQVDRYSRLSKEKKSLAVKTGLIDLDCELGGGLYPGDFVILGARPGMGKTTFMQQIANFVASYNPVLFASGEMNEDSITDRDIASALRIPLSVVRYGEYEEAMHDDIIRTAESLKNRLIYLYEGNRKNQFTVANLIQAATKIKLRYGLSLIVVDYLGLLRDKYGLNQVERLGFISSELKTIAMELGVPILCAHQLNRASESRDVKIPQLHDLRDSGNLEQDADVVLFLYRDSYYGDKSKTTDIIIAKQRQGDINDRRKVQVYFDNNDHLYKNLAKDGR